MSPGVRLDRPEEGSRVAKEPIGWETSLAADCGAPKRSGANVRGDGGSLSIALADARGWRRNRRSVLSHSFQVELDGLAACSLSTIVAPVATLYAPLNQRQRRQYWSRVGIQEQAGRQDDFQPNTPMSNGTPEYRRARGFLYTNTKIGNSMLSTASSRSRFSSTLHEHGTFFVRR
jgi:hypothetical protein